MAQPISSRTRTELHRITLAGMWFNVWLWIISGAAMTQFARGLHTPDWAFGLLAALPFVGTLSQLPVSWWMNARGGRRVIFLWTNVVGRLSYLAAALVPWVLPGSEALWWPLMVGLLAVGWLLMQAAGPPWMNWMADVIPRRVRGRYFARRAALTAPVAIFLTVGVAYLMDAVPPEAMLATTSVLLGVAGIFGALDGLMFLGVHDPQTHESADERRRRTANVEMGLRGLLRPLKTQGYRRYMLFNALMNFSFGFMGHYIWLYVLDVVGWSNLQANLMIIAVPLALQMVTRSAWGRACDRYGKKPVLVVCWGFACFGSVGWVFITPDSVWLGYMWVMLVSFAWPGVEVANFNFLLDYSGDRAGGSSAVALNSLAVGIAGTLAGVFAGVVAAWLGAEWRWAVPVVGVVLTYHGVLILASTALRVLAMFVVLCLHEPEATGTRESIRMAAGGLWSNVRQIGGRPVRTSGAALRWAYRVDRKAKKRFEIPLDPNVSEPENVPSPEGSEAAKTP
ncbi:MAG: MFS transporter [Algisphaera sp.]